MSEGERPIRACVWCLRPHETPYLLCPLCELEGERFKRQSLPPGTLVKDAQEEPDD